MSIYTQADLDKIDLAIKSGNLLLSFGDRKIRRYDLKDLLRIRQMIVNTMRVAAGGTVPCIKSCQLTSISNL